MGTEVTLKSGFTATIRDRDEVTEREFRVVDRAYDRAMLVGSRLNDVRAAAEKSYQAENERADAEGIERAGVNALAEAMARLSDEEDQWLNGYKAVEVSVMVLEWSSDEPISIEGALSLKNVDFEELAALCNKAWRREDFGISPLPLAPTNESSGSVTPSTDAP